MTNTHARVHVSGHAYAGELLYLYNAVRPRNVMPVHGTWRHLRANAGLAAKTGVEEGRIVLAENGVSVDLHNERARISGGYRWARCSCTASSTAMSPTPRLASVWSWATRVCGRHCGGA
ncbi:RNA-metabolising metallo-beta-lactamase family protein [Mycobacteroides abscessus]|nr:RNA-metabolising metallo-beta-lactamase family protein [Mycobacteroides abscessus]